jgi:hypothetical protein
LAATSTRAKGSIRCDACGVSLPHGAPKEQRGLYLETRGDRVHREEPPLCEGCAVSIGVTFLVRLAAEEEEG